MGRGDGYSDIATVITPLTLRTGVAIVHGNNLMDTPFLPADGLLSWLGGSGPPGSPLGVMCRGSSVNMHPRGR